MVLLAIPVTIFVGMTYLQDQKYLFISLLVMIECMIPFFLVFEKVNIRCVSVNLNISVFTCAGIYDII